MRNKFIAVLFFLVATNGLRPQAVQRIGLECVTSFRPLENRAIFKAVPLLESNGRESLYASDNQSSSILKITSAGILQIPYERHGQGPGDLQNPMKTAYYGEKLFALDMNGLSIFDQGLKFISRFRVFKDVYSISASEQLIYMVEGQTPPNLITAYEYSGKKSFSFGERLTASIPQNEDSRSARLIDVMLHFGKLVYGNGKVYFISHMLGDILVFSEDGRFILKREFDSVEKVIHNKKMLLSSGIPDLKSIGINQRIFSDAQWSNGSIYCILFQLKQNQSEIWELDGEGLRIKAVYEFRTQNNADIDIGSLAVSVEKGLPVFYISFYNYDSGDAEIAKYEVASSLAEYQR
jgi:hypothetical protein